MKEKECAICGAPISQNARTCSSKCRSALYRQRKKERVTQCDATPATHSPEVLERLARIEELLERLASQPAPVSVQNAQHAVFVPSELKTIGNAGNVQFSAPIDCDDLMGSLEITGAKQDYSSVGNFLDSAGAMIKTKTAADFQQTAVVGKSRRATMQ